MSVWVHSRLVLFTDHPTSLNRSRIAPVKTDSYQVRSPHDTLTTSSLFIPVELNYLSLEV